MKELEKENLALKVETIRQQQQIKQLVADNEQSRTSFHDRQKTYETQIK